MIDCGSRGKGQDNRGGFVVFGSGNIDLHLGV